MKATTDQVMAWLHLGLPVESRTPGRKWQTLPKRVESTSLLEILNAVRNGTYVKKPHNDSIEFAYGETVRAQVASGYEFRVKPEPQQN